MPPYLNPLAATTLPWLQVFLAEGVFDDAGMLAVLGSKLVDSQLSVAWLGNRTRMWSDLLGDVSLGHVGYLYEPF